MRRERVDSIRGFACFLLVFLHASQYFSNISYLNIDVISNFNAVLNDFRMPLFSFLAGLIYAYSPVVYSQGVRFIKKKVIRLLVPFILILTFIVVLKTIYPSAKPPSLLVEVPKYLVYGYHHLWFLQSIFSIFLIYAIFGVLGLCGFKFYFLIVMTSIFLLYTPLMEVKELSLNRTVELLPFFTLGVLTCSLLDVISSRFLLYFYSSIFVSFFALSISFFLVFSSFTVPIYISLLVGFSTIFFIYLSFPNIKLLSFIGRSSFSVYLFHTIFISITYRFIGVESYFTILYAMMLGVVGPIVVELLIAQKLPFLKFIIGRGF